MWVDFARTGYACGRTFTPDTYHDNYIFHCRNPTPNSSRLPKWDELNGFPVNYYRIGNFHFDTKPMFGMESGGIFEDRARFWREIGAHLPAHSNKDEL